MHQDGSLFNEKQSSTKNKTFSYKGHEGRESKSPRSREIAVIARHRNSKSCSPQIALIKRRSENAKAHY